MEQGTLSRSVFDRPLRRDPILVVWALLNAVLGAFSLNSHTTWSGSLEWDRVVALLRDVTAVGTVSYLLLALLPAVLRRRLRGPLHHPPAGARSAWAPGVHAGIPPSAHTWATHPYSYGTAPSMFDRPLRRDPIVVFWLLCAAVMALVALNANTTWAGSLEAARVSAFLSDVTVISLMSFLLLCLFPAYVRWCWRGDASWRRQARREPGEWGSSARRGPSARGAGPAAPWAPYPSLANGAQGPWADHADRAASGRFGPFGQGGDDAAAAPGATVPGNSAWRRSSAPWWQSQHPYGGKRGLLPARAHAMPSFTKIDLPAGPLPRGLPIPVSWDTRGAHSVTINGKPGYPPRGFTEVTLDQAGPCTFAAEGAGRLTRHAWTAPVRLIELPTPHIELPPGPGLTLHASVDLSDGREPLADTLRSITARRLAFRPTAEQVLNPTTPSATRILGLNLTALLPTHRPAPAAASRQSETPTFPGES